MQHRIFKKLHQKDIENIDEGEMSSIKQKYKRLIPQSGR
jgi:hypothetical protein